MNTFDVPYLFELRHPFEAPPCFLDENKLNISPKLTFCDSYILSHAINILHKNYLKRFNVPAALTDNLSGIHM